MATKVEEAIKDFYTLKSKYEKKYNNAVKNIRESELSMEKKKTKMGKLKIKCVGKKCKNTKGTHFEIKKNHLIAHCGDIDDPCDLKIDIFRGSFLYLPNILKTIETDLEETKTNIIQLKLELLFGLSTEEEISESFTNLKQKYSDLSDVIANLNSIIIQNNMVLLEQPLEGDVQMIAKNELVRLETIKLSNLINVFRGIIKDAQNESNISSIQYFSDAIQQYIDKIIPLLQNIRKTKYEIQTIIDEANSKFRLVQIKTTLDKNQVELVPKEIIVNIK
jgi:hypothetical protein|tara:strand:+ start:170 stop:1000 length:831 start_codon:yes stop_codon:yes gene_type:complete